MTPTRALLFSSLILAGCNSRFVFDKPEEAGIADCATACEAWGQHCADNNWNVCVECNEDNDCTGNATGPRCAEHRCVQCKTYVDCQTGYDCVASDHECRPRCSSVDSDEACGSESQRCGTLGVCIGCEHNDDCRNTGRGKYCLDCGYCVACLRKEDCLNPSAPVCDPVSHQCVACSDGRDCASGCCDLKDHVCY